MICNRLIILAAGRATRMKASADAPGLPEAWKSDATERPKPLMRIGPAGEPFLEFLLRRAERAGFTEATLVISPEDEFTEEWVRGWNETPVGPRMRIGIAVQWEPRGTGDAVREALLQDPVNPGEAAATCNGDNLPTVAALRTLRAAPFTPCLLAFDREALGLPAERVAGFSVAHLAADGRLRGLVEKPDAAEVEEARDAAGVVRVSMNLFRFEPAALLQELTALAPHPERGEVELPSAFDRFFEVRALLESWPVLDLTSLADAPAVAEACALERSHPEVEVCASTPMDVEAAMRGRADRVELCAHWECGGLTPPSADIRRAAATGLPVHALIRPRAGHFAYSPEEWAWIEDQIQDAFQAGATRAVIGGLTPEGRLNFPALEHLVARFGGHRLVLHRALDASVDWSADAERLRYLGIRRILSSGGAARAVDGWANVATLVRAGFDVTVGSGVSPENAATWTGLRVAAVHASCRAPEAHETRHFDGTTHPVERWMVKALVRAVSK